MNITLFVVGAVVTLVAVYDIIYTILSPRGAGFIADRVSRGIWRFSLAMVNRNGRKTMLRLIGPVLLLIIVLNWIVLLWIGNTLMVYSDPESLWSASRDEFVPGVMENMYFAAYVLSSMGSGDYTPASDWWLFYTGFISYTGVVLISLGISFLLPVIEAITLKRQVSLQIHNLGKNPRQILERYENDDFVELLERLKELEPLLLQLAQYHLAYPVIHYFHSVHLYESLPVKLVSLDETMSVLLYKVDSEKIEDIRSLERAYAAMTYYLSTLASAFIQPKDDEPERPDTTYLQNASEVTSSRGTGHDKDLEKRRKLLLAYLQNDGWNWRDMEEAEDTIELDF